MIPCPICSSTEAADLWREGEWRLVRCTSCDLVYVGNPPDEDELQRLYSFEEGFHTQLADDDSCSTVDVDAMAAEHLRLMTLHRAPGSLLDVGCATGRFMMLAEDLGWTTTGVELNDDTAGIARKQGLDVVTGTLDDLAGALGADDRGFDAVCMWDLIEHVPDPVGLLRTARTLLTPGGRLWIATPNIDGLFPQASLRAAGAVGRWPHVEPPYHLCQFSEGTLTEALRRAGYRHPAVLHRSIPLQYTFGTPSMLLGDPRRLAYTAALAPLAYIGPAVRRGDTLIAAAVPA